MARLSVVAPKYLFATLNQDQYETYASKFKERAQLADRAYVKALLSNKIVRAYEAPAYDIADESRVFLNPSARVTETIDGELHFNSSDLDDILEDIQHTSGNPLQSNAMNTTAADLALAARISKAWIEESSAQTPP